jgi:hypothetical protein
MSGLFNLTVGRIGGELCVVSATEGIERGSDLEVLTNAVVDALLAAVKELQDRGHTVTLRHMDGAVRVASQAGFVDLPKRRATRKKASDPS